MRRFATALGFLTIIPTPGINEIEGDTLGKSMATFPLVGLLLGGILLLINAVLSPYLTERLTNIIIITALIVITGGLHIDGFMDTIDGLAGGKNREEILEIMRDSRVGALGVVGIVLLVMLKWEALNALGGGGKTAALLLMPALGRWGIVHLTYISTYAREEGLGRPFVNGLERNDLFLALAIILLSSVVLAGTYGLFLVLVSSLLAFICSKWFLKKIGGVTGDVIGAFNEFLEMMVLVLFSLTY